MAAIAGILGGKSSTDVAEKMLTVLAHRGGDHRRLLKTKGFHGGVGVAKLSAARGDGFAQMGETAVLFDGEIYNDRQPGQSDADVALELYRAFGPAFAGHLEGVFACVVVDGDTVLLARDAVGVRPMYWGTDAKGGIVFASETKALVGLSEDVTELPPATTWSSATGLAGYLPRYPAVAVSSDLAAATQALRETVMRAVQRRLEDGAPGACLLSGGLDSSIIAAAAKDLGADLPLITVGMEGAPDLASAKLMAEHLGLKHHVFLYDTDRVRQAVPKAVWVLESFDEDCVSGAIANLFASAKAREFTNCILSGEGGDELFGGYHLLKDQPTEAARLAMMHRLIEVAYNTAVQRLDRAMMGNGITYRTPFIDTQVIALAMQLPVSWKVHPGADGQLVEKFILREAFRDLLPDEIYRRAKLRFSAGTGTDDQMDGVADGRTGAGAFTDAARTTAEGYTLNSPKERWYYEVFKERFPAPCFERLVGRWDPDK